MFKRPDFELGQHSNKDSMSSDIPVRERFAVVEWLPAAGVEEVHVALVVLVPDGDGVAAQRDGHRVQRLWPHSL